jgi:hypothetical protein
MEIELGEAVAAVRAELLDAAGRGAGSEIAFAVGPIELEFTVELRKDAKAKAGFKAWVVTGDAEAGMTRSRTHKVKVTLNPKRADGSGDVMVGGRAAGGIRPREH